MKKQDKQLRAKKFDYILEEYLSAVEVQKFFGYGSPNMMYKLRHGESPLTEPHIKLLEYMCSIPSEVFEKSVHFDKDNTSEVDKIIKSNYEKKIKKQEENKKINPKFPFYENNKLLTNLIGTWYAYSYGTSPKDGINGIYTIETTIHGDQTVTDMNGNRGRLFLGSNQSMIIKESTNSKDLVSVSFNNIEVSYGVFHFTLVSKRNVIRRSMCNFGFFSKKKLSKEEYMKILGDKIEKMQLQMDSEFEERVSR